MAGDWIKVETHTPDKPEIYAIAEKLGLSPDDVFGKCFRVWAWFDAHTTNGKTNGASVSELLVNRIAGVNGFAQSMISVGWLVLENGALNVSNFDRHNGETAKTRGLTAKRVAKHASKTNVNTNDAVVSNALPREEKRREELKTLIPTDVGIAPSDVGKSKTPKNKTSVLIKTTGESETELQSACRETWNAYGTAYANRYRTSPVRNARVNSQIKQFVQCIGLAESPQVAAFYVTNGAAFYVTKMHSVGMLLADAEKLRTEWATNKRVTNTQARQSDKTQAIGDVFQELIEEARERSAAA